MKPRVIVHIISSLERGGAQTVLASIIQELKHPEFEHHVLYIHDGPYRSIFNELKIPTHSVAGFLYSTDPSALLKMIAHLKRIKPDFIHSSLWAANFYARFAAYFLSIPLVCALHNRRALNGSIRNYLDLIPPRAPHLVAVSAAINDDFGGTCTIIENGIVFRKRDALIRPGLRNELGLSDHYYVVGSVGRLEPVKRYDYLIRVFADCATKNPDMRLMLVGSGTQEQVLRTLAQQLNVDHAVIFVGDVCAQRYYQLFDCFVQPSRTEGISLALLEAMSIGLPCIATHETSHHPVITHNINGFVVDVDDISMLAETIMCGVREKQMMKIVGANAQKTIMKSFEISSMIGKYKILFANLSERKFVPGQRGKNLSRRG